MTNFLPKKITALDSTRSAGPHTAAAVAANHPFYAPLISLYYDVAMDTDLVQICVRALQMPLGEAYQPKKIGLKFTNLKKIRGIIKMGNIQNPWMSYLHSENGNNSYTIVA